MNEFDWQPYTRTPVLDVPTAVALGHALLSATPATPPASVKSSADIMLAVERKEVDGRAGSFTSLRPFIDRGLVRPVVRARTSEPGIDKLPSDEDLAPNARAKAIMALRSAPASTPPVATRSFSPACDSRSRHSAYARLSSGT